MAYNYIPKYSKWKKQDELASWIHDFVLENNMIPSYNRIISQFGISRTTCYAWMSDLEARGRINKGVPYENENLQVRSMLGDSQANKKAKSYSNKTSSCGTTSRKTDDSHVGI